MSRALRSRFVLALLALAVAAALGGMALSHEPIPRSTLTVAVVLVIAASALLVLGVLVPLITRERALAHAVRRLTAGDAEVRVPLRSGPIGAALERLAQSLDATGSTMRRDRDLMAGILEGMDDGVLVLDDGGGIALVNPALRDALLLSADVVGRSTLEAVRHAELQALIARARASGEPVTGEIETAGIKPRRLLVKVARLAARRAWTLIVFLDVTDLRRLENLRREFVANVSHELRTPVSAIRSAAETLTLGALADAAAAPRFVDIIDRNGERLQRLIEDLLDLSRIESREFKMARDRVALGPVIQHGVGLLRDKAEKREQKLVVDVPDDLPDARADRRALEQVLANLVDNAIKYCPAGATITVTARPGSGPEAPLRVAVEDTGPGIEERHLPRLFERFYRVDPGRSRDMGGTGLGLSIVKHVVEAMGGQVGVTSQPGRGSTFWFTLPRWQEPSEGGSNA